MINTFWLSFDLGVQGEYENLYRWLAKYEAKECGNNLAVFKYKLTNHQLIERIGNDDNFLPDIIRGELEEVLTKKEKIRIYLVYRHQDTKKMRGKFLFGSRRVPPWHDYIQMEDEIDSDD